MWLQDWFTPQVLGQELAEFPAQEMVAVNQILQLPWLTSESGTEMSCLGGFFNFIAKEMLRTP